MKKKIFKLLFVLFLVCGSAINSQTSLPGTIEVEDGDVTNNSDHAIRNTVGSGNGGNNNIIQEFRKDAGVNGNIINYVSIATDGNYDFEFTYFKNSSVDANVQISSTANDGSGSTVLKTFTVVNNSDTASDSDYGSVLVTGVPLTTAMTYLTIESISTLNSQFDLDNVIVSTSPLRPTMTSTKLGDWDDPTVWAVSGTPANVPSTTPTAEYKVIINHAVTIPRDYNDTNTALAASITANGSPAQLIIRENAALTVTGDVTLTRSNDAVAIYGQLAGTKTGTMIFGGTYTASKKTFVRKRLSSDKWHLISSPFNDSKVNLTTRSDNTYLRDNGTLLSLASYDTATDLYSYFTNGTIADDVRFGNGQGYSISTSHATKPDYYMTGDQHSGPVSYTLSTGGNGYNLLGNPYFSYLHANDAADATNNILRVNGSNGSNILVEDTIWLWDADSGAWVTKNLSDASFRIAPLQGFFVKASSVSAFNFTKDMESHDETDAFLRSSNNRFEVDLSIDNGDLSRKTSMRYIDNTSTSFDNGYDSSMFGGYSTDLAVYSNLVEGDSDKKLAIQSLPNENFENMIVPVGVTAAADSEITFTIDAKNVPSGYKVFLEDRLEGTFTRLDEVNTQYIATVTATSTEGRFYLHTRPAALSTDTELLNSVSIYKSDVSTLRVVGLSQGNASVKIYSMIGKQVLQSNFTSNGVKEIALPNVTSGVYIVQLETETGSLNKKIVL